MLNCTVGGWDINTGPDAGSMGVDGLLSRGVMTTPGLRPRGLATLGRGDRPGLISLGRPRVIG